MITAVKERWKDKPWKISMPVHKGKRAYVSCTIADLQEKDGSKEFDAFRDRKNGELVYIGSSPLAPNFFIIPLRIHHQIRILIEHRLLFYAL